MNPVVAEYLAQLTLGEFQTFKNISILPLFAPADTLSYLTLKEALAEKVVTITEVSESGSVPNLKLTNLSQQLVLLLDGEELVGAKQNRVLNSSILVAAQTEIIIPVSCTEHGRWQYKSAEFASSDLIMSHNARYGKSFSVKRSLEQGGGYQSNQSQVWADIEEMHQKNNSSSATQAMNEVYATRENDLQQCLQVLVYEPNQVGGIVFINGRITGVDILPNSQAYQQAHPKFIKSYALEALLEPNAESQPFSKEIAQTFLTTILQSQESQFPSAGLGQDVRFEQDQIIGSALVYENHPVHLTFFHRNEALEKRQQASHIPYQQGYQRPNIQQQFNQYDQQLDLGHETGEPEQD